MVLTVTGLDDATVEPAGALMACEQAAARRACPQLPALYADAKACAGVLQGLRASGHSGAVVLEDGRPRRR